MVSIKGYKWHSEDKCWSLPYSELKGLLTLFGEEKLDIDPSAWLDEMRMELVARRYSQRTIKLYLYQNRVFLEFSKKNPYEVSNADVRDYLYHLANDKEVSTSTLNTAINALKFYHGEILKQRFVYDIKRPRKDKKLPVVLSQEEISQILSSVKRLSHNSKSQQKEARIWLYNQK